ncbi:MAG: hypothetical protein AAGE52_20545 [Myxococcota bacterium]
MTRLLLTAALAGCATSSSPSIVPLEMPRSDENFALFATFAEAEVPDVAGASCVIVYRGPSDENPQPGFLLEDHASHFVVLHYLTPVRYSRASPSLARHEADPNPAQSWRRQARVLEENLRGVDHIAGEAMEREALTGFETVDELHRRFLEHVRSYRRRWRRVRPNLALLLLAYHVHRQGHPALAGEFLRGADTQPNRLTADLAHAQTWAAMESLWTLPIDRRLSLSAFRQLKIRFPESPYAERVTEIIGVLEAMANETPQDSHVHALVFKLRDDPSVQSQLEALGFAAVPALLEAADRSTLVPQRYGTRYPSGRGPSDAPPRIRRYRDVALEVLARIARRRLGSRAEAERWWGAVRLHGEYALLRELLRTRRGSSSVSVHDRLLALDPEQAILDMIHVARTTERRGVRATLVRVLAARPGEAQTAFLREVARSGPGADRLRALEGLARRNDRGWLNLVEEALRQSLHETSDLLPPPLFRLLVQYGDAAGVRMLKRIWRRIPREQRGEFVHEFEELPRDIWAASGLLDDAIAIRLAAPGTAYGTTTTGGGHLCRAPEYRDWAAGVLARWFDQPFDCRWSIWRRARERARLHNLWRDHRRQPAAPLPTLPDPPPPDFWATRALRNALSRATFVEHRREIIRRLAPAGLVGLSTLKAALHDTDRELADPLMRRLASTVCDVQIHDLDQLVTERTRWEALEGRRLRARAIVELLNGLPRENASFALQIYRSGNGRGVVVVLRAQRSAYPRERRGYFRIGDTELRGFASEGTRGRLRAVLNAPPSVSGEARLLWR